MAGVGAGVWVEQGDSWVQHVGDSNDLIWVLHVGDRNYLKSKILFISDYSKYQMGLSWLFNYTNHLGADHKSYISQVVFKVLLNAGMYIFNSKFKAPESYPKAAGKVINTCQAIIKSPLSPTKIDNCNKAWCWFEQYFVFHSKFHIFQILEGTISAQFK